MSSYEVLILDGKEHILKSRETKKQNDVEIIVEKFLINEENEEEGQEDEHLGTLTTQIFPDGTKKIEDDRDTKHYYGSYTLIEVAANGDKKNIKIY